MSILINKPSTEAKIRELAVRTGEDIAEAIERAVDERLARLETGKHKGRIDRSRLAELRAYFDSLPKTNELLSDEEIIGYDQLGLPK